MDVSISFVTDLGITATGSSVGAPTCWHMYRWQCCYRDETFAAQTAIHNASAATQPASEEDRHALGPVLGAGAAADLRKLQGRHGWAF